MTCCAASLSGCIQSRPQLLAHVDAKAVIRLPGWQSSLGRSKRVRCGQDSSRRPRMSTVPGRLTRSGRGGPTVSLPAAPGCQPDGVQGDHGSSVIRAACHLGTRPRNATPPAGYGAWPTLAAGLRAVLPVRPMVPAIGTPRRTPLRPPSSRREGQAALEAYAEASR